MRAGRLLLPWGATSPAFASPGMQIARKAAPQQQIKGPMRRRNERFPRRSTSSTSTSSAVRSSNDDDAASLAASPLLVEELNGKRTVIERGRRRRKRASDGGDEGAAAAAATSSSPLLHLSRALRRRAEAALLPRGYPTSVTPDYLEYQLASLPVHITGWVSSSLATSALLAAATTASSLPPSLTSNSPSSTTTAVATVTAAAASSAAVNWVAKDGLGAAGRLLTGSKLGTRIDDDPRRWRLAGEALTTVALALDIASPLVSAYWGVPFLAVAGLAAFASAAARGVARPAARVIQTHFASASRNFGGNVGDVSAKEEVWEVAGQVVGLAAGVVVLDALLLGGGDASSSLPATATAASAALAATSRAPTVAAAWLLFQGLHVLLRVRALRALRFDSLNHKRGCLLASAFVARELQLLQEEEEEREGGKGGGGGGVGKKKGDEGRPSFPLPTPAEIAALEPLLASPLSMRPRVSIGATVEEAFPTIPTFLSPPAPSSSSSSDDDALPRSSSSSSSPSSSSPSSLPPPTLRESLAAHGTGARHALSWREGKGKAVLLRGAQPRDALCLLLQCSFLETTGIVDASSSDLSLSWRWARERLDGFLEETEESGWRSGPGTGLLAGAARLSEGGEEEEEVEKRGVEG